MGSAWITQKFDKGPGYTCRLDRKGTRMTFPGVQLWEILAIAGASGLTTLIVLWALIRLQQPTTSGKPAAPDSVDILFDGAQVVDCSGDANLILGIGPEDPAKWSDAVHNLQPRFPGLPDKPKEAYEIAPTTIVPSDTNDLGRLSLEPVRDGMVRLSLTDPAPATIGDRHLRLLNTLESNALRSARQKFPYPVWHSNSSGEIIWTNTAYADLVRDLRPSAKDPERTTLFDLSQFDATARHSDRFAITDEKTQSKRWFSVTSVDLDDEQRANYAIAIDALVEAEVAQRKFVQTLTKTFAQLSIGLAIFDRNRQLALFNPALIDLTALSAEFLSARPNLLTFFDRLRESHMMPEPKDYSNWRHHIADMVVKATDGRYHETWTLPSGLTYRVTGRPHPDGAIAILFEDISAEISLTRHFRSQLSLGQSVMDTLEEAIAVFSSAGTLSMSNEAFRRLWKFDPDSSFAEVNIQDATRIWSDMCKPTPIWTEIVDFIADYTDRSEWYAKAELKDDVPISLRLVPLAGGSTLVAFRRPDLPRPTCRKPVESPEIL